MALAAGSFNGDRYTDLVIGAPGEDMAIFLHTYIDAGAVNVIFGSNTGLSFDGDQFWSQNSTDVEDALSANDKFGHALAAYYRMKTYLIFLPTIQRD